MCLWCNAALCQEGGKASLLKVGYDSTAGSPFSVMGGLYKSEAGLLDLAHDTGSFLASGFQELEDSL